MQLHPAAEEQRAPVFIANVQVDGPRLTQQGQALQGAILSCNDERRNVAMVLLPVIHIACFLDAPLQLICITVQSGEEEGLVEDCVSLR